MIEFYFINIFFIVGLIILFFLSQKNNKKIGIVAMFIFSIPYILFVGLRDINYGEDSFNYFNNFFLESLNIDSITELFSYNDLFFMLLNKLISIFGTSWQVYAFSMSIVCVFLLTLLSKKTNSRNSFLYFILIINSIIFVENTTNIIRSTLCSIFLLYGYLTLVKNRKVGITIIVIGFLTHLLQSLLLASVFAISYFLKKINLKMVFIKFIFFLSFVIFLLKTFTSIDFTPFLTVDRIIQIQEAFSENEYNYSISQITSSNSVPINIFIQVLIYILVPLLINLFITKKTDLLHYFVVTSLFLYSVLYPDLIFALRMVPIIFLVTIFLFVRNDFKYKYFYIFAALITHIVAINRQIEFFYNF